MAGKVHTDSEALYAIRSAITKFADDIQTSQSDFYNRFEGMNYQIEDHLRDVRNQQEKLIEKKRSIDTQKEELVEQKQSVDSQMNKKKDGRTDSFVCDICNTKMMLKVYGDETSCKSSNGCNGKMHRVFIDSEYQKYKMASDQLEKKIESLEIEKGKIEKKIKDLETEEKEITYGYDQLQKRQQEIIGLLNFGTDSNPETTVGFIDKAIASIGVYQSVSFDAEESEDVKKVKNPDNTNFETDLEIKIKPTRHTPRNLPATEFGFTTDSSGNQTYDSPLEMDKYLYSSQGTASVYFQGTCGLCSCANVLRLAGVNHSEKEIIDYAANTPDGNGQFQKLCIVYSLNPNARGGTNAKNRKAILEHFGISSEIIQIKMENGIASDDTIKEISNYVMDGKGVILSVHANMLYYGKRFSDDYHAVTVTSVVKNKYGDISGFYICDSNRGTTLYSTQEIQQALTGADMNVTESHIR